MHFHLWWRVRPRKDAPGMQSAIETYVKMLIDLPAFTNATASEKFRTGYHTLPVDALIFFLVRKLVLLHWRPGGLINL
jgi:hypothetical protein